jgi:hypothetical protein
VDGVAPVVDQDKVVGPAQNGGGPHGQLGDLAAR